MILTESEMNEIERQADRGLVTLTAIRLLIESHRELRRWAIQELKKEVERDKDTPVERVR